MKGPELFGINIVGCSSISNVLYLGCHHDLEKLSFEERLSIDLKLLIEKSILHFNETAVFLFMTLF